MSLVSAGEGWLVAACAIGATYRSIPSCFRRSGRAVITMPSIDARRMMADLRRLVTFGEYRTGVHRPTYSPQDVAARYWLVERMQQALAPDQ